MMTNKIALNWSDAYVGEAWTKQQNCFYWTAKIIKDLKKHNLPLVEGLSFFARTRVLLKEEKRHWKQVAKPSNHFDLVLMRHTGSQKNAHHIGVWTEANGGAVVHAVDGSCIDLDSLLELKMRGFEIKRVMRLKGETS